MNARFSPRLAAFLVPVLGLLGQEVPRGLFVARDLNASSAKNHNGQSWKDSRINVDYYSKINPRRSLLLYDCAEGPHWCEERDFGFERIFSQMAKLAKAGPDEAARRWYRSAAELPNFRKQTSPWSGQDLAANKFQLLAIVNRMDLAKWDGTAKMWTGAELRFVYGPAPVPPAKAIQPLTLIAEFVLPAMDGITFRSLAKTWLELSQTSPGAFTGGLKNVILKCRTEESKLVKLRLNHDTGTGPWQFAEWDFEQAKISRAASDPFERRPLQDQISSYATRPGTEESRAYLGLWRREGNSKRVSISVPPVLNESQPVAYSNGSRGMPSPIEVCDADTETRNILSLQQCSFCHSSESGTKFMHISNRAPGRNSKLSGFLTGKNADGHHLPPIDDLCGKPKAKYAKPFRVTVRYKTPAGGNCEKLKQAKVTRSFNDLARRGLFLSAVLLAGDDPSGRIQDIDEFRTDFSH